MNSTVIPLKTLMYACPLEIFAKDALYFSLDMVVIIQSISECPIVSYVGVFIGPQIRKAQQDDINYLL